MQSLLGSILILSILNILVTSKDLCAEYKPRLKFFLTNRNSRAREIHPDQESIEASEFTVRKPTVVLIHDYDDDVNSSFNKVITSALKDTQDSNVIHVDWSRYMPTELDAFLCVNHAGYEIKELIDILCQDFNYNAKNIHIIGFGAGAHVAGSAGRQYDDPNCGRIEHITGLDPMASLFSQAPKRDKLGTDSAIFVEVIHTNIEGQSVNVGYDEPLGHLDFYPNGGSDMPGCDKSNQKTVCSHTMSYKYLAEALRAVANEGLLFVGKKCDSYHEAIVKECYDENHHAIFGTDINYPPVTGQYYFETNPKPPYAQGR